MLRELPQNFQMEQLVKLHGPWVRASESDTAPYVFKDGTLVDHQLFMRTLPPADPIGQLFAKRRYTAARISHLERCFANTQARIEQAHIDHNKYPTTQAPPPIAWTEALKKAKPEIKQLRDELKEIDANIEQLTGATAWDNEQRRLAADRRQELERQRREALSISLDD